MGKPTCTVLRGGIDGNADLLPDPVVFLVGVEEGLLPHTPSPGSVEVDSDDEERVRSLITRALSSGRLTGPDGRVTRWMVQSSGPGSVRPDEADHAARLIAS